MNDRVPREPKSASPRIHHVQSGTFSRLATALSAREEATGDRTDTKWTLLPTKQWADEFSPLWRSDAGSYREGLPRGAPRDPPQLTLYEHCDPCGGTLDELEAVNNEVLVDFYPSVGADTIRGIAERFSLDILSAWFEVDHGHPSRSVSWFHMQVRRGSSYDGRLTELLSALDLIPEVECAAANDAATLCQASALYPRGSGTPNDPKLYSTTTSQDPNSAQSLLNVVATWRSSAADLGTPGEPVCVVVMDTGIDIDHEDLVSADGTTRVYTLPAESRPKPGRRKNPMTVGRRQGIRPMEDGTTRFGDIEAVDPPLPDSKVTDPKAAKTAPAGRNPDDLKFVDLEFEWHGHGTAVAGVIAAAGNNEIGSLGCAYNEVKVMSATLRMPADRRVDVASAIKCVKKLKQRYGRENRVEDVRVVVMGFTVNAKSRPRSIASLLQKFRADKAAGNDRVWIAPAGNNLEGFAGDTLSYPAAIYFRRYGADSEWSATATGEGPREPGSSEPTAESTERSDPVVLGVTTVGRGGVRLQFRGSNVSNFYSPRNVDGTFTFPAETTYLSIMRATPYVVSGAGAYSVTLDVRDRWYGVKFIKNGRRGRAANGAAGYLKWDATHSGDYDEFGAIGQAVAGKRVGLAAGNSVSAALVAGLAGMIFSKEGGSLSAMTVANRIIQGSFALGDDRGILRDASTMTDYVEVEASGVVVGWVRPPIDFFMSMVGRRATADEREPPG